MSEQWKKISSLTTPSDRDEKTEKTYKLNKEKHPPLTEEEVTNAMKELNNDSLIRNYPDVERRYCDPPVNGQKIGLVSFVPSKGATPNSDGFYGFVKLRGNFDCEEDADVRSEELIRTTDSYHQIYHTYVGRPFPLTTKSDFAKKTKEVDIKKEMTQAVSTSIKQKKKTERKEMTEIEEREKELLADVEKDEEDPIDYYTTLRVKKAQVTWTYLETMKKIEQMKETIINTRKEIEEMETKDSSYKDNYYKTYCDARKKSGLSNSENQDTFMKFLVEDADLGF